MQLTCFLGKACSVNFTSPLQLGLSYTRTLMFSQGIPSKGSKKIDLLSIKSLIQWEVPAWTVPCGPVSPLHSCPFLAVKSKDWHLLTSLDVAFVKDESDSGEAIALLHSKSARLSNVTVLIEYILTVT